MRSLIRGPKVEEAFSRFEVLERRVDYAEGRAEAFDMGEVKSLEAQIADLRTADAVEAELQALKSRLAEKTEGEMMEAVFLPIAIVGLLVIGMPWLCLHYRMKSKKNH